MENESGIIKITRTEESKFLTKTTQTYFNELALMYEKTTQIRELGLNDERWKKVGTALNQCCIMIGSMTVLSNDEYYLMKDFLISEYKDFSAEEIIIAFKKVSSGAISVKLEHFGKLSPMYLGAVLKAFREERHKALATEEKNKPKKEMKPVTTDEKIQIRSTYINQCIITPYVALKYGNNKFERTHTNNLFRFLYENKLIEPSGEELKKYKDIAVGEMLDNAHKYTRTVKEKNLLKIEMVRIRNGKPSKEEGRTKQEAAHLYMIDWLKALSNSDVNFEKYLRDNGFYKLQNEES